MTGKELISILTENNDLPNELIARELKELLSVENLNENSLTLDQLRELMANYLQDVLVAAKEAAS